MNAFKTTVVAWTFLHSASDIFASGQKFPVQSVCMSLTKRPLNRVQNRVCLFRIALNTCLLNMTWTRLNLDSRDSTTITTEASLAGLTAEMLRKDLKLFNTSRGSGGKSNKLKALLEKSRLNPLSSLTPTKRQSRQVYLLVLQGFVPTSMTH